LQRRDIDLDRNYLTIDRTMTACGGTMVLGPPKSDAGYRGLNIPPNVLPYLTVHLGQYVDPNAESWLFKGKCRELVVQGQIRADDHQQNP
jgi:hypothetical protein